MAGQQLIPDTLLNDSAIGQLSVLFSPSYRIRGTTLPLTRMDQSYRNAANWRQTVRQETTILTFSAEVGMCLPAVLMPGIPCSVVPFPRKPALGPQGSGLAVKERNGSAAGPGTS